MRKWISIKETLPPRCGNSTVPYVIAHHTVFGVGVAWFWEFERGDGIREQLEEDFDDKYLCSCQFIKNMKDGDYGIDDVDDIDIFERSPHFFNLGTVTHWMPLPEPPVG